MKMFRPIALILFLAVTPAVASDLSSVRGKTVMVVQAHPDDCESRCAGTVALLKRNGNKIVYVVATNDDKGTYDANIAPQVHAALRQKEEEASVRVLGVDHLEWLGYSDGWLDMVPRDQLRGDVVRQIRKYHPDILMAFDPQDMDQHMDHRASAVAAADAVTASPFPLYYPDHLWHEKLSPHQVKEVFYYDTPFSNVWVDITSTIEIKIDALAQHVSQKGSDREAIAQDMKRKGEREGKEHGFRYAEGFRVPGVYIGVKPKKEQ